MRKILFLITVLGFKLCLPAQFDGDTGLQQAFTTYMQQRMAPEAFRLDRLDTVLVFRGDLDRDGVDDAAIQWREGLEQRIVTFSKKDDGYKMSAEADCVWIRQKRMVFDLTEIGNWGLLGGSLRIEYNDQEKKSQVISDHYLLKLMNGELLGQRAAGLSRFVAMGGHVRDVRKLLILSWPIHHLGGSSILWEVRFLGEMKNQGLWGHRHRYLQIHDSLGSEMEAPTTLTSKIYPAKKGRQLLVLTWQEESNAEWDSQNHWAAFWDHGKWIPAMNSVFPPLDGRIFFDSIPDDPDLLHEGWQVALNIDQYTNEITATPANKLEIIQGAYPELVAKMKAPLVRFVWNRHKERFELMPAK